MQIDPERGAQALFEQTFNGTLPLLPTWEEQPLAFKNDFRRKAVAVASAAVVCEPGEDAPAVRWLA